MAGVKGDRAANDPIMRFLEAWADAERRVYGKTVTEWPVITTGAAIAFLDRVDAWLAAGGMPVPVASHGGARRRG